MRRKHFIKLGLLSSLYPYMGTLSSLYTLSKGLPSTERMPVLFLGHGSPMNAIEENEFVQGFRNMAASIPKPKAILCISAHWYTNGTKVTAMEMPRTIHDFGGFPKALFDVKYPAPGSPALAKETAELVKPVAAELDDKWGLDHGAWSVIKHLYPDANIPVVQFSIDYTKDPSYHFELANRLCTLRDKGVLIIGSGNIVHNLRMVDFRNINNVGYGYDWAIQSRELINNAILDGDFKKLTNYTKLGKEVQLSIPTPEHFLPLIYCLGLKEDKDEISLFNDELLAGSISMTSVRIA
jgi:4,5-DOPA dioxygenase extradiol